MSESPPILAVTGATGFLGRAFLARRGGSDGALRLLERRRPVPAEVDGSPARKVAGDLHDRAALRELVVPGCRLLNLAHVDAGTPEEHTRAGRMLAEVCQEAGVEKVVHCSTVAVAGRVGPRVVDETVLCRPGTPYERRKHAFETGLREAAARVGLSLVVLRPGAVFGPGGMGLRSMARSLLEGSAPVHEIRYRIMARRALHLVPAAGVVAALEHAERMPVEGVEVFHATMDEDPDNDYRGVDRALRRGLGLPPRRLPGLVGPEWMHRALLRLTGRHEASAWMDATYRSDRLRATGFRWPVDVASAVVEFGRRVREERRRGEFSCG